MPLGQKGIEHLALAFYGFAASAQVAEALYQRVLRWFDKLGCPPQLMATSFDSGKVISFKRSAAKVTKLGFAQLKHFALYSLPSDAKHELEGRNLYTTWDRDEQWFGISARTSIARHFSDSLLPIAKEVIETLQPQYGIGFRRDENLDPGLFILGRSYNTPDTADGEREGYFIEGWRYGIRSCAWQYGFVRDVYPWSFLRPDQLAIPVQGQTLESWIRQRTDRGLLRPIARDTLLWEVPDQHIPVIRTALIDARAIFDGEAYHRIYYRAVDGRSVPKEEILRRLKDPNYVLQEAPALQLSADQVLRQVFDDAAAEELRVLHVNKSGPQPNVREVPTQELRRIQRSKKKKA